MLDNKHEELNLLIEFIREQYKAAGIDLDYSLESVKAMDELLDSEYANGKLVNPGSSFAEKEGMILTGVAGYLANVLVANSDNAMIMINEADKNWYINFEVQSANGWTAQPGQRVIKRKMEGEESALFPYAVTMTGYFNGKNNVAGEEGNAGKKNKKWWKPW